MCDHYTNEVNGSAVLTIRWMPPSGTVPLCGCVLLLCASLKLFWGGCVYSPQRLEHKKVLLAVRFLHLSPRLPLSAEARGAHAALNRPELSLNFTNGCDELMTSRRLSGEGKLLAFFGVFFFLFANYKC